MVLLNKIGIITFHNAINYGAVLQAYAQQRFLNINGLNAEIIDYQCDEFKDNYKIFKMYDKTVTSFIKAFLKIPLIYKKNRKFYLFLKKYVKLSLESYTKEDILEANKKYKFFIVGSDQVWNLKLTHRDKNYLLEFVDDNKKKVSYAASIGNIDANLNFENVLKNNLKNYASISVRENDAKTYLENILEKEVSVVLDPVFLLDMVEWNKIAFSQLKEEYIFVYCLHEVEVYEKAKILSEKTGLKIICIQNSMKKPINAKYIFNAGPQEFVGYIKNAKYVVTDSFHGVAFGIIYHKNIKVVLKKKLLGLNSRIITLLSEFNLMETIINSDTGIKELLTETKYNKELINNKILYSKKYLLNMADKILNNNDHN